MSLPALNSRLLPATRRAALRLTSQLNYFPRTAAPQLNNFSRNMASVPSTMKAVVVDKTGGPEVLRYEESFPVPKLKDNQVLVKNELAGVNYIDTYFRSGLYPSATGYPLIVGQEAVGKVVATQGSDLGGLKEGDFVIWIAQGGYGEYTAIPADRVVKIPSHINHQDILGSFLMGITALSLIKEAYEVKKGDKILIHAAAGGVGLLLCQLLRSIGATVYGTASTTEKCELAKKNGADHMINYKDNPDWVSELKKLVPDGVDCVYDSVGQTTWEGSLEAVKRKGTVIYFGNASGPVPPLNIQRLAAKNTKIMRSTLMQYIVLREELEYYVGELFKLLESGDLKVKIHKVYDLSEARQAHEDLQGRLTSGKLLLKI